MSVKVHSPVVNFNTSGSLTCVGVGRAALQGIPPLLYTLVSARDRIVWTEIITNICHDFKRNISGNGNFKFEELFKIPKATSAVWLAFNPSLINQPSSIDVLY